ncbi:MAG TPA: hypothetical protein VFE47_04295 [Tepidisphaeraceae bacterium]|jgi:hypothetical protein|nr:hypothetical protein [Tepidisphaeraceae bacterium]
MSRRLLIVLGLLALLVPAVVKAEEPFPGVYRSDADDKGVTEEWTITGSPGYWKIEISLHDKAGKEIGHGHVATATRKGKEHELNFVVEWNTRPEGWPDFPHCQMVMDETDKDKATFKYQNRRKDFQTGVLHRVKK